MKYQFVFVTTLIALFWDECIIGLFAYCFKQQVDAKFIIIWTVISGVLAGVFVSFHLPNEYHSMTMILIGIAVLFSFNGHRHDKPHGNYVSPIASS